jgi:hypothetical protein
MTGKTYNALFLCTGIPRAARWPRRFSTPKPDHLTREQELREIGGEH